MLIAVISAVGVYIIKVQGPGKQRRKAPMPQKRSAAQTKETNAEWLPPQPTARARKARGSK